MGCVPKAGCRQEPTEQGSSANPAMIPQELPGSMQLPPKGEETSTIHPDALQSRCIQDGPLRGHGFDMGMIFANRPHARTLARVISFRKILFSESRVISGKGDGPMQG